MLISDNIVIKIKELTINRQMFNCVSKTTTKLGSNSMMMLNGEDKRKDKNQDKSRQAEEPTITASKSMIAVGTANGGVNGNNNIRYDSPQTPQIVCTGLASNDKLHDNNDYGPDSSSNGGLERKLSSKEKKKRRQKEAEKIEKLRMLVSYLKSGTSQQLLNPIALEADELELAQRYKMHQILCEECLQAIEQNQQQPTLLSSLSSCNLTTSQQALNPSPSSCSNNTSNCCTNMNYINPQIGTISWVLKHSISDPGNSYNNEQASSNGAITKATTTTTPPTPLALPLQLPACRCCHHHHHLNHNHLQASSSILSHSDNDDVNNGIGAASASSVSVGSDPNCSNNRMLTVASGDQLIKSGATSEDDDHQQLQNHHNNNDHEHHQGELLLYNNKQTNNTNNNNQRKLFYIDDLDRKDSDTSDSNSQFAIDNNKLICLTNGSGTINTKQANNNNHSDDINNNEHTLAQKSNITSISQSTVGADSISRGSPTRGWSSELMIFSSTPAAAAPTTVPETPTSTTASQKQTSAWTNPPNLATWIDNEVNSLVNDLEAKSQFISKQKSTKSIRRKWLSSSNRRGSSGAHST